MNFTLQDILSATLAFCLFPLVIVFPGYVVGWAMDLFDFSLRQPIVRFGIGLVLSFIVSPIVLHLTSSMLSFNSALFTLLIFAVAFCFIVLKEQSVSNTVFRRHAGFFLWVGIAWVASAILSLINIQWGDRLFLSVTSYDQTTRVSIIDAMTRTGVPPINPGYYPGHPVQLTFLYYFWYILGSMIDVIGGQFVDARAALNASSAWAGLGMMAVIALYLSQRNANRGISGWRSAKIGVALLCVSGLDVFPTIVLMAGLGKIVGSIDVWNTWIQSWIASALWVPHHLASLIAGLCVMMLAQFVRGKSASKKFVVMTLAGFGFASAVGLSIYVTFVFVLFWGAWLVVLYFQKTDRSLILPMVHSGVVAILLASPFLLDLVLGGSGGKAGQFPIVFEIREFLQLESYVRDWSPIAHSLMMLAVLPIHYMLELGFFFIAGLYWFQVKGKKVLFSSSFYLAEILLLIIVVLIGSTLRSTLITSNDLGWRAWLPGQFILLIWGVDVLDNMVVTAKHGLPLTGEARKNRNILLAFISIGILSSVVDAALLRGAWPVMSGLDTAQRYYYGHLAYDYLRDHAPANAITQNNPRDSVDRPSGFYGTHQMVISGRTAYGVSVDAYNELGREVAAIFLRENIPDWEFVDEICRDHQIDILIMGDIDPVWVSVPMLKKTRSSLYENAFYAVFACGDYATSQLKP